MTSAHSAIRAPQSEPAGRLCPPHYGYSPRAFARPPEIATDTLYAIGGLYGNPYALDAIDAMAATEVVPPKRVFNGDFHWFDAEPDLYAEIQRRVVAAPGTVALRGNVETEIASDDGTAGCGCAYPESVPDDDVERSNAILARLRAVARTLCEGGFHSRRLLGELPMHAVALVGEARIAVVHGDAWALAGWRFAHDSLHDEERAAQLAGALELGAVDGYACSHTCAPALKAFERGFVINNGAAGMANFAGTSFGVLTRISTRGLPRALERTRLYGLFDAGCFVDALKIEFDLAAWLARFDAIWPADSPAAVSYRRRILEGPAFTIDQALGRAPAAICRPATA
ncbi:hypothetical protein FBR04_03850 [Betaproteobacteria bacterium PRO7]|nr:hypothetical protein [Betaproteobacteria bacterium PRO7]